MCCSLNIHVCKSSTPGNYRKATRLSYVIFFQIETKELLVVENLYRMLVNAISWITIKNLRSQM